MSEKDESPKAFSPRSLADRWHCSERHVRNLINRGDLPYFKLGGKLIRIKWTDVDEYERKGGSPATTTVAIR
ncbi:helix-turn-helix domain-containing protein [Rhizobium mongolense]|uniref:helix-turn-helix domain-containing protein n=1 Tax=Rhizobium mongolense TaxID=57676 RepID=UPI0034A3ABE2